MTVKSSAPAPRRTAGERPHLVSLLLSLLDARVTHVDVMDTTGEAELENYYRARRAARREARASKPASHP
jgi:hypothetical protein